MVVVLSGLSGLHIQAAEPAPQADTQKKLPLICAVYPSLASSSLTFARLADLPAGVILKAQGMTFSLKEVADEVARAPEEIRGQLEKNGFFVLENLATQRLLVLEAKAKNPEQKDATTLNERDLVQQYVNGLAANLQADDIDVLMFYEENKEVWAGATLDQVKDQLKQVVLQQKRQKVVNEHVRTLGQRIPVEVSAAWAKEQSVLAKDNPVDKARSSGKPSLVDFGATGCRPCEMLAPILEALKEKYAGKVNVLFVHVGQEQILAARYGISSIPMQCFYDKNGKEVFRHLGFWPQDQLEKKLAEMGVK
jgi:thiol-disulfide isomerase/thioredoxin